MMSAHDRHAAGMAAHDRHEAGASRLADIIGLISADHPQLWTRDALITRAAESISERHDFPWEFCCTIAEHEYDPGAGRGPTLHAALRYRRRVWARDVIGAEMVPETRHTPLPVHGPREQRNPHLSGRDCGCGWGDLCDASPHGICEATSYRKSVRLAYGITR